MWVVYGIDTRSKRLDTGEFFCTRCGEDRLYDHIKARRWFHVYGVGLLPLGTVGEFAECIICHETYDPSAIDMADELRQAQAQHLEVALVSVVAWMIATEDGVDEDQAQAAAALYTEHVGQSVTVDELVDAIAQALSDDHFAERLTHHTDALGEPQREALFEVAYAVTAIDGQLSAADAERLQELATHLGISRQTCARLVDGLLARRAA